MIKTVTLNPAVDKTIEIDNFTIGAVNRVSSIRLDAGGKGINVSKIIKTLGGKSKALGVLAGRSGKYIKDYLDLSGIENDFVFISGETRTNLKVVDKLGHTNTDINEPGLDIPTKDMELLENKIFPDLGEDSILVLSGSVPHNVPSDIYGRWIQKAKSLGARTILDADGDLLKEGIKAGPYLIKPNIHELERLLGRELKTMKEIADAALNLINTDIEIVVVSLGGDGAIFVKKESTVFAEGIKVDVKSTVGAGDSMVAALSFAIDRGYPFEKAVTLSVASGTASVTMSGTQPPEIDDILEFEKQVRFRYI